MGRRGRDEGARRPPSRPVSPSVRRGGGRGGGRPTIVLRGRGIITESHGHFSKGSVMLQWPPGFGRGISLLFSAFISRRFRGTMKSFTGGISAVSNS